MSKEDYSNCQELLTDQNTLSELVQNDIVSKKKLKKIKKLIAYEKELKLLQIELIKFQNWVIDNNKKVIIFFEGRDAAGKGGAIKRFTEHLNPRNFRVVALSKPSDEAQQQWYFQRYIPMLPSPGEITFFDRSWYNRAVVEPVMGFCSDNQYKKFMTEVTDIEHSLVQDEYIFIKFWFSVDKDEQKKRFDERKTDPLKQWKISPVDEKAQDMWDRYTFYKDEMFSKTHTSYCPWIIVNSNDKKIARINAIKYVLSQVDYAEKDRELVRPNPNYVQRYHATDKFQD